MAAPSSTDSRLKKEFFVDMYETLKSSGGKAPWDVEGPQPALAAVAEHFKGKVLDVGCGLGNNAIWLANLPGVEGVTAVDYSAVAIEEAKRRLAGLQQPPRAPVVFEQGDVFQLSEDAGRQYDVLLDSAVFHCIGDDSAQRRYLASVTPCIKPGGAAVMLVFSDQNPDPWRGPRRISAEHARSFWTEAGWDVSSIDSSAVYNDTIHNGTGHAILMVATRR